MFSEKSALQRTSGHYQESQVLIKQSDHGWKVSYPHPYERF